MNVDQHGRYLSKEHRVHLDTLGSAFPHCRTVLAGIVCFVILFSSILIPYVIADWTMYGGDSSHSNVGTGNPSLSPTIIWNFNGKNGSDQFDGSPAVVDDVMYIGADDANVYALNATSGVKLWAYTTGGVVRSSPAVVDGVVYIGSFDDKIYALNAANGAKLWDYSTGASVYSSPAVVNGVVYVGSEDGNLYALDAANGNKLWNRTLGSVVESPAVADGMVYIGSWEDGVIYALNAANGAEIWSYSTGGSYVWSSPVVVNGVVYGVYGGSVEQGIAYALNATNGAKLWSFSTGTDVEGSPAFFNGVVYIASMSGHVYALDASSGSLLWSCTVAANISASPVIAGGAVYVGGQDGLFYALDASSGVQLWNRTVFGVISSPAVVNGVVYLGSDSANAYALGTSASSPTSTPAPSPTPVQSPTPLPTAQPSPNTINSNSTWTTANSPYTITSPTIIARGVTVTIQPGVTVDINQGAYLQVNGALKAVGSGPGSIQFNGAGSLILANDSIGCVIENADVTLKSFNGFIVCSSAEIQGDTITCGIYMGGGSPVISGNNITGQLWGNESLQAPLIINNIVVGQIFVRSGSPTITKNVVAGVLNCGDVVNESCFNPLSLCVAIEAGPTNTESPVNAVITDNTVTCGAVGIAAGEFWGTTALIENNLVENCTEEGMSISSTATVENNTLINNNIGIWIFNFWSSPSLTIPALPTVIGNNIINSSQYSINYGSNLNLNATYNWWGTTDPASINQTIYDHNSDPTIGNVIYLPCLTAPNPMAYPNPNAPLITPIATPTPTSPANNTQQTDTTTTYFSTESNSTATADQTLPAQTLLHQNLWILTALLSAPAAFASIIFYATKHPKTPPN